MIRFEQKKAAESAPNVENNGSDKAREAIAKEHKKSAAASALRPAAPAKEVDQST